MWMDEAFQASLQAARVWYAWCMRGHRYSVTTQGLEGFHLPKLFLFNVAMRFATYSTTC